MFTLFWCVTPCILAGAHQVSASLKMEAKSYFIFIYLLQLGCHPVAVVILHVNKT